MEAEMRRLKQELKQTLNMYSTARKEAVTAKHEVLSCGCKFWSHYLKIKILNTSIVYQNRVQILHVNKFSKVKLIPRA